MSVEQAKDLRALCEYLETDSYYEMQNGQIGFHNPDLDNISWYCWNGMRYVAASTTPTPRDAVPRKLGE